MKPGEVLEHYKSCHYFNKYTGMSASSLFNWLKWGYIPFESQKRIEEISKGELNAVWEDAKRI